MEKSLDIAISAPSLVKFALPTIGAQVFMSIYGIVDALFVSNLVGTDALGAVNIVSPVLMCILAIAAMLSQGGRALVAAQLGGGKQREARENFSLLVIVAFVLSAGLSVLGLVFLDPLLHLLGSNQQLLGYCRDYAVPILVIVPFAMLGIITNAFLIAEGRPGLGSALSVVGGVVNVALDYILIAMLGMGVAGAAIATSIGYSVSAFVGMLFFLFNRKGNICFVRPKLRLRALAKMSGNGISEMVMMLSSSITTVVLNNVMIRLAGADGVAAITIVVYAYSVIGSAFYGYNYGVAPIASYNFGKENHLALQGFYRICLKVTAVSGIAMFAICLLLANPLVWVFVRPESSVFPLAVAGLRLVGLCFLFMGFNDFASSFFTSLNNGKVSGIIAFMRTFVFSIAFILLLPALAGLTGLWLAMPATELTSLAVSFYYFRKMKGVYHYA